MDCRVAADLEHRLSTKHRAPGQSLQVLVSATETALAATLSEGQTERLHRVLHAIVAKRGAPSSRQLTALRARQARDAGLPLHRDLARLAAVRLADADPDDGLADPSRYASPVDTAEAQRSGLPAGTPMPPSVTRALHRATSGTVSDLVEQKVVVSAEVLAELVPALTASTVAGACPDPALSGLLAQTYRAFRRRRSLLLLNLHKQVQFSELPWVAAVLPHLIRDPQDALEVARMVSGLALQAFPGRILPNPLVRELSTLLGSRTPLVEEVAADIFMGTFTAKFVLAAQDAARLLKDTVYQRYYDIDPQIVLAVQVQRTGQRGTADQPQFAALCKHRAGEPTGNWLVDNGRVLEQCQILTTHNLAAVALLGARPEHGWMVSALGAFDEMCALLDVAVRQPRPKPAIKNAAYAWRQALFFVSMAERDGDPNAVRGFLEAVTIPTSPPVVDAAVTQILDGLNNIAAGERFDRGLTSLGRQFLGWTAGRPWVLDATR